jgi:tetratricopeptide (TPR) repeat protein
MARKFDEFAEMMLGKCMKLQRDGKHEDALQCMVDLTKKMPDLGLAWYYRGLSLHNLGRYKEAIESYDKAIELNDKDWASISARGLSKLLSKNLDDAKKDFDKSLLINPRDVPTLVLAAVCSILKGEAIPAEAYMKEALKIDPKVAGEMYSSFINAFAEQKELPEEGKKKLRSAIKEFNASLDEFLSLQKKLREVKRKGKK